MAGRPKKEIKREDFEKLCNMQCTLEEIAGFFDCCEDTIQNWCKATYTDSNGNPMNFSVVYKKYSAYGKISLRRAQFRLAEKSAAMAIFLGKQYLGQKDDRHDYNEEILKLKKREQQRKEEGW
jgi:hypothetical protein